jgi:hypothetical protein
MMVSSYEALMSDFWRLRYATAVFAAYAVWHVAHRRPHADKWMLSGMAGLPSACRE